MPSQNCIESEQAAELADFFRPSSFPASAKWALWQSVSRNRLGEGDQYADLNPSISICILDSIMFRDQPALQHAFGLRTDRGLLLADCLQVHVFELPKHVIPGENEPITDPIEQWLYLFREAANQTAEELARRLPCSPKL